MKKIFVLLLICILLVEFRYDTIYAKYYVDDNGNLTLTADCFTDNGKIKINSAYWDDVSNVILISELNNIDRDIPKITFTGADGNTVLGIMTYTNYNEQVIGNFDLNWIFTPDDSKYETKSGVFHFNLHPSDNEGLNEQLTLETGIIENAESSTTITASTLLLTSTASTYDINLENKPSNATYKWTSSNEKVAKVNKSGIVTPVSDGDAIITCAITNSDGTIETLTSNVTVGQDDNYPVLSEEDLTISVSDTVDLNVENLVKGSIVKFKTTDKTIAKVNSKTGLVTGVREGTCQIITTITKDKEVTVLVCNVEVE